MSQSNSTMSRPASDTLSLTSPQQKTAWNDLHGQADRAEGAVRLQRDSGRGRSRARSQIEPVPSKAASAVPALKSFDFAMVSGKLLIVNPSDKKIVEVISG